ncbi:tRNA uridine-5-carboxymethylaminomethyl(34) synthesis GTPase MnmE [Maricaulaceae bacterium EIL42A08]|nr:tRNA uridine-5-carboxymethylaminomethyl(34) synthesis GTPase MnmE [Maricaulaceae bacterium EIL42A08]
MPDTIYALASAPGRAGVAVMRVSGPEAGRIASDISGPLPPARVASLRAFKSASGEVIDQGLLIWFEGPRSFTAEDSAEFHIHGGPAVVAALADALGVAGARAAEAGEFTRRAFSNGKFDLTEAEGLADLIDAETEGQRAQALAQLTGSLKDVYSSWRDDLIAILAALEGEIDFPDEDDVPDQLSEAAGQPLKALIASVREHLDDGHRGERVREGFVVALIGAPNAGKSSLLNRLARREAAIVTDIPGTTRDIVEVRLVLGGFPVILADTAGLREAADAVEAEGVRRALARAEDADLRLAVVDVSRETQNGAAISKLRAGDAVIFNKMDIEPDRSRFNHNFEGESFEVSALKGGGVDRLEAWLSEQVAERLGNREAPAISRARHREGVTRALDHLNAAQDRLGVAPELASAEIHLALRSIESLTGRIDVEDVLDRVFSQFCIGK